MWFFEMNLWDLTMVWFFLLPLVILFSAAAALRDWWRKRHR
jgi:hypothetical protein